MIYPVGAPVRLCLRSSRSAEIISIAANRERNLVAVLTPQTLLILQSHPEVVLASTTRSEEEIEERGLNVDLVWKPDSSAIAVTTTKNHLLVYRIQHSGKEQSYVQNDSREALYSRTSQDLFLKEFIPKVNLKLAVVVRLASSATCVVPLKEELLLCLQDGWLHRLVWNGTVLAEYSVHLSRIPFSHDQMQSRTEYVREELGVYVKSAAYSPLIGGFSFVLSNGRAALLTSPTPKFQPSVRFVDICGYMFVVTCNSDAKIQQLLGVWAPGLVDATCNAVNHKYRLLAFGCGNSEVAVYHLDEASGALIQAYRVKISVKDNPESVNNLGCVRCLEWSPYGIALCCAWEKRPVTALLSTFGAQIWCSADNINDSRESDSVDEGSPCVAVEWGPEAYQLWMGDIHGLSLLSLARTIGLNNPVMEQLDHVCLMSSDRIIMSPDRIFEENASAPHSAWNALDMPSDYMANSWPLRYCALDATSGTLCIAGSRGLAHCNLKTKKWRLFGNESQEREIVVSGGLGMWNRFVVAACYDVEKQKDDFRFYPTHRQLDNLYCTRWVVDAQILMMSLRHDILVTFDVEARICLFQLCVESTSPTPTVSVTRCAEVLVSDMIFHPACVNSVHLTALNHDSAAAEFCAGADTLLVNVAGRLVTLSPQKRNTPEDGSKTTGPQQQLQQPLLVASYVEKVWHDVGLRREKETPKPHLSRALWLLCGSKGMKVWMPLFPGRSAKSTAVHETRTFISKRIMLPFDVGVYPLVISSRDCLAYGVESVGVLVGGKVTGFNPADRQPSWQVHRNSQVFLHHLLRQLLKRNLGLYALDIAATCRGLPYFGHVLELLLHGVLEEEATSSEPIPDPLLPRVVAFIQEFPEFLQTVAHCARKTELALWQQLFATAGNPKDLFEVCIRENKLDTAASFLIVLQNMETAAASKEHATLLLEASLEMKEWKITRDIVRFLRAIDPSDIDSPPRTPLYQKQHVPAPRLSLASPTAIEADAFVFQPMGVSRQRHSSISAHSPTELKRNNSGNLSTATTGSNKTKLAKTQSTGTGMERKNSGCGSGGIGLPLEENSVHVYLNLILNRHARDLLSSYSLADLGRFAAHLEFHLVLWLGKERNRAARVQDFPQALLKLHQDFQWPYPILSSAVVEHLNRKIAQLSSPSKSDKDPDCSRNGKNGNEISLREVKPLSVITRRVSMDSGIKTLDVETSRDNPTEVKINGKTKQLLMKQNGDLKLSPRTIEAQLTPQPINDTESIAGGTEGTEESWQTPSSPFWEAESPSELDWEGLEQLCGEAAARGPQHSEAELRFLQQLMLEATCLEWSLLICIILRDLVGLARAVNVNNLSQAPEDTLKRLQIGIRHLVEWSEMNCVGYKPLVLAVQRHLDSVGWSANGSEHDSGADVNGETSASASRDSDEQSTPKSPPNTLSLRKQTGKGVAQEITKSQQEKVKPNDLTKSPGESIETANWNGLNAFDSKHPADGIHVDIVSPMTPTKNEEGQCALM